MGLKFSTMYELKEYLTEEVVGDSIYLEIDFKTPATRYVFRHSHPKINSEFYGDTLDEAFERLRRAKNDYDDLGEYIPGYDKFLEMFMEDNYIQSAQEDEEDIFYSVKDNQRFEIGEIETAALDKYLEIHGKNVLYQGYLNRAYDMGYSCFALYGWNEEYQLSGYDFQEDNRYKSISVCLSGVYDYDEINDIVADYFDGFDLTVKLNGDREQ